MNLTKANLVLAIAACALAVPTWLTLQRDRESFVDLAQVPHLFEGFSSDQVHTVILAKPKPESGADTSAGTPTADGQKPQVQYDQLRFQRTDKGFVIGAGELAGAPVNSQMLDLHVWKHLGEIRCDKETLVQADASDEQLAQYGLDQQHAFVVKAGNATGATVAELLVGSDAGQGQKGTDAVRGVYVRSGDSRDVVLYETPFWNRAVQQDQWLDRTLMKVPGDQVRKIEFANESGTLLFERPAGTAKWTATPVPTGKTDLRQIEVENMVQRFAYLQANELLRPLQGADLAAFGLDQPRCTLTVHYEVDSQDKSVTLRVGKQIEGKNELYASISDGAFVVGLAAHFAAPFEQAIGQFFDGVPEPASGGGGDGKGGEADPAVGAEPPTAPEHAGAPATQPQQPATPDPKDGTPAAPANPPNPGDGGEGAAPKPAEPADKGGGN